MGNSENTAKVTAKDKHRCVLEAVKEGLLQVNWMAPNTKQQGIFWNLGENCNGLNNKISRNMKIGKALDIKDNLDINCLMYCKHHLNFKHKNNKNDLTQMFQRKLACMAVSAHNIHEGGVTGRVHSRRETRVPFSSEQNNFTCARSLAFIFFLDFSARFLRARFC